MKAKHVADEALARRLYEARFGELPFGDPQPLPLPPRPDPWKEHPRNHETGSARKNGATPQTQSQTKNKENPT